MIVTVTPNPSIDRTVTLPGELVRGAVHRVGSVSSEPGGKGVNVARALTLAGLDVVAVLPAGNLPTPQPKPFFDLLDRALSDEIRAQVKRPFWIDTVGQSRHVEIRVKLDQAILRFVAQRGLAYASNSHIFLIWMVGTSVVLLTVAILFLRNQIRPVLRLAEAADAFGKGRPFPPEFRPRGAREVRQAAQALRGMAK